MARTTQDTWNPQCLVAPMFEPLRQFNAVIQAQSVWPSLTAYQTLLDSDAEEILTHNGHQLRVVEQGERTSQFSAHYEPRIFLKGELQTRKENWHDFFQILVWRTFPKTKSVLNARHYHAASQRLADEPHNTNRSPIENALALFDECGAILVCSQPQLLQYARDHLWHKLFWINRAQLATHFRCIIFGHALYEKALTPYIGMTAQAIPLLVDDTVMTLSQTELNAYCDERIAQLFHPDAQHITSPKDLAPFPLLGMPGWDVENNQSAFYDNKRYFRPKRMA